MITPGLDRPWLTARLDRPLRLLSWAPYGAGFSMARVVVWREVRDADLTLDFDALTWLHDQMEARGQADAIGFITSRDVGKYSLETARSGRISAHCLATVGLTNAERVGTRQGHDATPAGTINLLAVTDAALSDTALIELLSIATEARTAAVMDHGPDLPQGRATGTGTDCIAVGCVPGDAPYAGLHTEVGEAVGAAVYRAVASGVRDWMREQRA